VWVDPAGRLTGPPFEGSPQGQAVLGAVLAVMGLGCVLCCAGLVSHGLLGRRRLAAWESDWQLTGSQWDWGALSQLRPGPSRGDGESRVLPGLAVLRRYQRAWLPRDLLAGVTVAAYLVPQVMAYAQVAGLPPPTGLTSESGG
jgi:Sulfate permease family